MDKFLLLRDRSGLIQLRLPEDEHTDAALRFGLARLPLESVVEVRGTVRERPAGQENPQLATGRVEVELSDVLTALPAKPNLPFQQRERILPKVVAQNVHIR
jgi:aspartyl-tRNA synthetase